VSVYFTESPSSVLPGEVVGAPVRIPALLLCQAAPPGRRWCGTRWTANSAREYAEMAAMRREHERTCKGGLIVGGD
jgi:hypothetical protein